MFSKLVRCHSPPSMGRTQRHRMGRIVLRAACTSVHLRPISMRPIQMAAEFAGIMNTWCDDFTVIEIPKTWAATVFALLGKGRGEGVGTLRPISLVSLLQRSATRCLLSSFGPDTATQRLNGDAHLNAGSVGAALLSVRLLTEKCIEWGEPSPRSYSSMFATPLTVWTIGRCGWLPA